MEEIASAQGITKVVPWSASWKKCCGGKVACRYPVAATIAQDALAAMRDGNQSNGTEPQMNFGNERIKFAEVASCM